MGVHRGRVLQSPLTKSPAIPWQPVGVFRL
jgi:hypothetical protein